MEDLEHSPGLEEQQRIDLANLGIAYRLRQADLSREEGDLATAYDYLAPMLRVNPNDPRLLMALARLYNDSKESEKVLELYDRVLRLDPGNMDAFKGAVGASIDLKEFERAQLLLDGALELDPSNPRLYALAGRLARTRGEDGRALDFFRRALELDALRGDSELGGEGSWRNAPTLYLLDPGEDWRVINPKPIEQSDDYAPTDDRSNPFGVPKGGQLDRYFNSSSNDSSGQLQRLSQNDRSQSSNLPSAFAVLPTSVSQKEIQTVKREIPKVERPPESLQLAQAANVMPAGVKGVADRYLSSEQTERTAGGYFLQLSTESRPDVPVRRQEYWDIPSRPQRYEMDSRLESVPGRFEPIPHVNDEVIAVEEPRYVEEQIIYEEAPVRRRVQEPRYYEYVQPEPRSPPPRRENVRKRQAPVFNGRRRTGRTIKDPRDDILREMSEIRSGRSAYGAFGLVFRNRDGQSGLDKLLDIEAPIEFSFAGLEVGRAKLRLTPVFLDAGTLNQADLQFFGTFAFDPDANVNASQDAEGVGLNLVYDFADWRLDIGTTPIGFRLSDVVGGVRWSPSTDKLFLTLNASRRAVADSVLSYAGARDVRSGIDWGGVTKTGIRGDLVYADEGWGLYGNLGFHSLVGKNVANNSVFEFGGGFFARAYNRVKRAGLIEDKITWGVNVTSFLYDKNLRRFSLGHGGYFSPQFYLSVGMPINWEGRRKNLSYTFGGTIGIQAFRENGVEVFPDNGDLQTALGVFATIDADADGVPDNPNVIQGFDRRSQTGLGFTFYGGLEYLVTSKFTMGGRFTFDNASDFRETSFLGYVRYWFRDQIKTELPPNILEPYYTGKFRWLQQ